MTEQEWNPFQTPEASLDLSRSEPEPAMATRSTRLGAAMLDAVFLGIIGGCLGLFLVMFDVDMNFLAADRLTTQGSLVWVVGVGLYFMVNGLFLYRNGQTLGKKILNIKAVRKDGSYADLSRTYGMRYLAIRAVDFVPGVGVFFGLIDVLFIFGENQRCLHDLLADTIVIKDAPP